jgi:hypothetical protein
MDAQLWECRAYYAPHIAKSLERTIQRCNDYVVQQADNDGYVVTKAGFQGRGELGLTHFLVSLNVESNKYVCIDGCGKSIFKGKPCVHMVKVFQHLGLPLFQASYVHEHWKIMKNWNFDNIKKRCGERSVEDEDDDEGNNGHEDDGDGDGEQSDDVTNDALSLNDAIETNVNPVKQQQNLSTGSALVVSSKNRYVVAKKLFDQVAAYFSNKDIFNGFIDVVRSVLVTCSSTDVSDGFARIKAYVTVDPRLQKQTDNGTTLLPARRIKEGRRKISSRGKMVRSNTAQNFKYKTQQ